MGCTAKLEVGKVFTPDYILLNGTVCHPPQPCLIVREATIEEWRECALRMYGHATEHPAVQFFYEVSTD